MGLIYSQAAYLAKHCLSWQIRGRLVTLGRLDYYLTFEEFGALMVELGIAKHDAGKLRFSDATIDARAAELIRSGQHMNTHFGNKRFCAKPIISDTLFYTALGFTHWDSIDMSPRHGAPSLTFDLNQPDIARVMREPYDLTLDTGVMEHVFDVKQLFVHMTDLTKIGGHIIHMAPGNNMYDHGFYQLSPTLFNDYYRANRFEMVDVSVLELRRNAYAAPDADFVSTWDVSRFWPYDPAEFSRKSFGQLAGELYFSCACVQRTAQSTRGVAPTQYLFQNPRPPYPGPW
jgi:hypothetical protein